MDVGAWVYENFNDLTGVSFLPHTDHIYKQAPFTEIDKDKYVELNKDMPQSLDWTELGNYENTDQTVGSQTMACTSGSCEVI